MDKIKKETILSIISFFIAALFGALTIVILARILSPATYGRFTIFFSITTTLFLFGNFGINASAKTFIARYNVPGAKQEVLGIIKKSFVLRIVISILFCLVIMMMYEPISSLYKNQDIKELFIYIPLIVFLWTLIDYFKHLFRGYYEFVNVIKLNIIDYGSRLIIIVFLFLCGLSLVRVAGGFLLAAFLTFIAGVYFFTKNMWYPLLADSKNEDNNKANISSKKILSYALILLGTSLCLFISTEVDTLMLGFMSSSKEVGYYGVAKLIAIYAPMFAVSIGMGVAPFFAKKDIPDGVNLKKILYKTLGLVLPVYAAGCLFLLVFSDKLIFCIFGEQYLPSVKIMNVLVVFIIVKSSAAIMNPILDYMGKAKMRLYNLSFCATLNVILNCYFIAKWDAYGAGLATSIAYIPYPILNFYILIKELNKRRKRD